MPRSNHGLDVPVMVGGATHPSRLELILEQDRSWFDARGNHHAVEEMDDDYLQNLLRWLQERRVDIRRMAAVHLNDPSLVAHTRVAEWIETLPLIARLREEIAERNLLAGEDDGSRPRGLTGQPLVEMVEQIMAEDPPPNTGWLGTVTSRLRETMDPALEATADETERAVAPRRPLPRIDFDRLRQPSMEELHAMRRDAHRSGVPWCDDHMREHEYDMNGRSLCPSCAYGTPPISPHQTLNIEPGSTVEVFHRGRPIGTFVVGATDMRQEYNGLELQLTLRQVVGSAVRHGRRHIPIRERFPLRDGMTA